MSPSHAINTKATKNRNALNKKQGFKQTVILSKHFIAINLIKKKCKCMKQDELFKRKSAIHESSVLLNTD